MKTNTIFKRAYNRCLAGIAERRIGDDLGPETALAQSLAISRTTVRSILDALIDAGIVTVAGRQKIVTRYPEEVEYFPDFQTESVEEIIERKFMEWTLRGDCRAGQHINGLDLARQFGVSPSAIREYLNRFSHYGFIQRMPNSSWVFLGFNNDFAEELCDVRELFELRAAQQYCELDKAHPVWKKLDILERQHILLLSEIETRFCDFSELDERFHRLIYSASHNRFMDNFHATMRIVFHYHYLWNKADEKERNIVAIQEHLAYIAALKSGDREACLTAARAHMRTVRATMLSSITLSPTALTGG
ncbi:GntR family transcriptional regulator [Telmatospirillum siberiense]|uniref:GntR family transcriptional regulator n=1 Tax=Telmatospirillum siberiense TaxID=382514 RepID=A0A2N3PX51_9PROT|nr:GntR family transcriptional regulator [Telmatospirillum siberiense]PKU24968.1 GntR family transcriptional regulator [Telmatospirillum siberiense]